MEWLAQELTRWLQKKRYITQDQTEWCHYILVQKIMNMVSFCVLVPVGALVAGWYGSIAYILTFRFLRRRTGGYHARTPHGCLLLSICMQLMMPFLGTLISSGVVSIAVISFSCASIALQGPSNHPELHLTQTEIKALRPRIYLRIAIVFLVFLLLLWNAPLLANCMAMATFAVAVFMPLSFLGDDEH